MLVPEVAQGLSAELDACRAACREVVAGLTGADRLVVVGAGRTTRRHAATARGSLAAYGVEVTVGLGDAVPVLPLSLTIGRWLLGEAAGDALEVAPGLGPRECADLGRELVAGTERVSLLVMADGSAYPLQTPVGDDGRGARWDDAVAAALGTADADALLELDPADDGPLWVAGRPGLQVLAGALRADGCRWNGQLRWRGSPYGVGYVVASLEPPAAR